MAIDFVAIDFETANSAPTSACEVGIAVVRQNQVVETHSWLIRPPQLVFNPFHVRLHGIGPEDVRDQPTFRELWTALRTYVSEEFLVAHNASFDMQVLRSLLLHYRIAFQPIPFLCSLQLSRKVWSHAYRHFSLASLCEVFRFDLQPHQAESDARACALITMKAFDEFQIGSVSEVSERLHLVPGMITRKDFLMTRTKYKAKPLMPKRSRRYRG